MKINKKTLRGLGGMALLTVAAGATPAHAAAQIVVAPLGAQIAGTFDTPITVAIKSQPLEFVNLDAISTQHNVKSEAYGPDSAPWCAHFPLHRCPLFVSALVNAGGVSTADLSNTVPGQSYTFVCQLHGNMKGTLLIVQ
ncbi:MAG: cupredoxin domain-containing protein [Actinomycetota bacterium]